MLLFVVGSLLGGSMVASSTGTGKAHVIHLTTSDGCELDIPAPERLNWSADQDRTKHAYSCPTVKGFKEASKYMDVVSHISVTSVRGTGEEASALRLNCVWTHDDGRSMMSSYQIPRMHRRSPASNRCMGRLGRRVLKASDGTICFKEKAWQLCGATVMIHQYFETGVSPEEVAVVARSFFGRRKQYPTLAVMEAYFDDDSTEVESDEGLAGPTFSIVSSHVPSPDADDDDLDLGDLLEPVITLSGK